MELFVCLIICIAYINLHTCPTRVYLSSCLQITEEDRHHYLLKEQKTKLLNSKSEKDIPTVQHKILTWISSRTVCSTLNLADNIAAHTASMSIDPYRYGSQFMVFNISVCFIYGMHNAREHGQTPKHLLDLSSLGTYLVWRLSAPYAFMSSSFGLPTTTRRHLVPHSP